MSLALRAISSILHSDCKMDEAKWCGLVAAAAPAANNLSTAAHSPCHVSSERASCNGCCHPCDHKNEQRHLRRLQHGFDYQGQGDSVYVKVRQEAEEKRGQDRGEGEGTFKHTSIRGEPCCYVAADKGCYWHGAI